MFPFSRQSSTERRAGAALDDEQPAYVADVRLASACVAGDPVALAELEARQLPYARAALVRLGIGDTAVDEAFERLREQLLFGEPAPKLLDYAGRGPLRAWLEISATRAGLKQVRKARARASDDELGDLAAPGADPELALLKVQHRTAFRAAFRAALASLSRRERNLLRHRFLDGLTGDQLATVFGVHRATVVRWLAQAQARVFSRTRKRLMDEIRADSGEIDSLMRMMQSQLGASIADALHGTGGA